MLGWGGGPCMEMFGEPLSISLIVKQRKQAAVEKLKGWVVPEKMYSYGGALRCMRLSWFLANRKKVLRSISSRPDCVQYRCPQMTTDQHKDGESNNEFRPAGLKTCTIWRFVGCVIDFRHGRLLKVKPVDMTETTSLWNILNSSNKVSFFSSLLKITAYSYNYSLCFTSVSC